jgi:hypothetical protein
MSEHQHRAGTEAIHRGMAHRLLGRAWSAVLALLLLAAAPAFAVDHQLTMAFSPVGGGSTSPGTGSVTTVASTADTAISASPAGIYLFTGWTAAPAGNATFADASAASTTVRLSGDATVTATFALGWFLTAGSAPAGWGQVAVSWGATAPSTASPVLVPRTGAVNLKAVAQAGNYTFAGWTSSAGTIAFADATKAETTATLGSDATVAASYTASYPIALTNSSGLDPARYTLYGIGFTNKSRKMLTVDGSGTGSFTPIPAGSGFIPSFKVGSELTRIIADNANPVEGARIYFFFKDKLATYTDNADPVGGSGGPRFPYSGDGADVSQAAKPPQTAYPPYNYCELTFLPNDGMYFDVSTVDGLYFPVSINAKAADGSSKAAVGQTTGVSLQAIEGAYAPFMDALVAGGEAATPYLDLRQTLSGTELYYLANPGAYLESPGSATSALHAAFDPGLGTLFASTLKLWQNGAAAYSDYFTGVPVTATFPGTANTHSALQFTGRDTGKVYTIFNPKGFSVVNFLGADGKYHAIGGTIAGGVLTFDQPMPVATSQLAVGMYLSPGGGSTDAQTKVTAITTAPGDPSSIVSVTVAPSSDHSVSFPRLFSKAPTDFYQSSGTMVFGCEGLLATVRNMAAPDANDEQVLKGLENQLATALNRGVALLDFSGKAGAYSGDGSTTDNWSVETNWYPKGQPQNLFSYFLHVAQVGGQNIFTMPSGPAPADAATTCARGQLMAKAYGFAYDENPLHSIPGPTVPAELFPSNMGGVATLEITFGPWRSGGATTAALTMAASPAGGGTTSPAVGVQAGMALATPIAIAATPAAGYTFKGWTINANGTIAAAASATTTVTLSGDATVTATFALTLGSSVTTPAAVQPLPFASTPLAMPAGGSSSGCGLGTGLGLVLLALGLVLAGLRAVRR